MTSLFETTKGLLLAYNRYAQKKLGQNFLVDQDVLDEIIFSSEISQKDEVLEIGCGLGVLTQAIAEKSAHVTTLDIDQEMISISKNVLSGFDNIEFVYADFLKWEPKRAFTKVVANVPYYITTPIIEKLLGDKKFKTVERIVLTVQKEVAERIASDPGSRKYGSFSVFVQNRGEAEIPLFVPRRAFYPMPNVDSAILVITPLHRQKYDIKEEVVKAAFSQRRKMIRSTLKKFNLNFEGLRIDSKKRAEDLTLEEFERISKAV